MRDDLDIQVAREPWRVGIAFRLYQLDNQKLRVVEGPLMLKTVDESAVVEPTFRISDLTAQKLMDMLWDCGLRPTEGTGSAGAMAATQKHLEDMRTLVFNPPKSDGAKSGEGL